MASANTTQTANDKLIIFRGDDTGGTFGRPLLFTIKAGEGVSLDGCRAEWEFDGIVKRFDAPLIPGEVLEVFYSHNETRCMELGVRYGMFRIIDAAGKVRTFTNTKPVEVTNNAARCYPGSSAASVVVNGIGDVKHSEFADLEEKEGMTLKEVGGMVNTLIRKLKGTVSAFAALLAFGAFADGAITPQTDFGDISPTSKIGAVLSGGGAIMSETDPTVGMTNGTIHIKGETITPLTSFTETDPTVPLWAKQPNPPEGMTDNALVLTNGAVKTKSGTTITPGNIGAASASDLGGKLDTFHSYNEEQPEYGLSLRWLDGYNGLAFGYWSFGNFYPQIRISDIPYGEIRHVGHVNPDRPWSWITIGDSTDENTLQDALDAKADKYDISATNPTFSNAVLAVTTNTIRREVSSALNTYVDGETGVEYEGKMYEGSLYYVPTGNVYPTND